MSNGPGTPPDGESVSLDVVPRSQPIEPSEVDAGWFDADAPAASQAAVDSVATTIRSTLDPEEPDASPDSTASASSAARASCPNDEPTIRESTFAVGEFVRGAPEADAMAGLASPSTEAETSAAEEQGTSSTFDSETAPSTVRTDGEGPSAIDSPNSSDTAAVQADPLEAGRLGNDVRDQVVPKGDSTGSGSAFPQSLSPVMLRPEGTASSAPPHGKLADNIGADPKVPTKTNQHDTAHRPAPPHSSATRGRMYFVGVLAVAGMAVVAIFLLRPKSPPQTRDNASEQKVSAASPVPTSPQISAVPSESAASELPPLATVANSATPPSSAAPSSSSDSFADAFKKNAAKKDAKWAEIKERSTKTDGKPAANKPAQSGAADPLDVLKRLEEARKNRK